MYVGLLFLGTDSAYVVLRKEAPQLLFVWTGSEASNEAKGAAAQHAADLLSELDEEIKVGTQLQGQETDEFLALFLKTECIETGKIDHIDEGNAVKDIPAAVQTASTTAKKKKKKKKNKANTAAAAASGEVDEEADPEAEQEPEHSTAEDGTKQTSAPIPENTAVPEEEGAANTVTPAAESGAVVVLSAEDEAVTFQAPKKSAETMGVDVREPSEQGPPAAQPATEVPVDSETPVPAGKKESMAPEASTTTPAKEIKPTTPLVAVLPTPSPEAKSSVIKAAKSYLADSAKAWGGVMTPNVGSPAVTAPPGDHFISYEELKNMRVESGIDMTCKEMYLSDEDFVKVFKKERGEWFAQPAWRRQLQKKEVGLW